MIEEITTSQAEEPIAAPALNHNHDPNAAFEWA